MGERAEESAGSIFRWFEVFRLIRTGGKYVGIGRDSTDPRPVSCRGVVGGLGLIPISSHIVRVRPSRLEERISINHIHLGFYSIWEESMCLCEGCLEISLQCARIIKINKWMNEQINETWWTEREHEKGHQAWWNARRYLECGFIHTHRCVFMPYLELVCFGFPVLKKCRGIRRSSVTNSESACKHGRIFVWREIEQIVVILFRKEMNKRRHNRGTSNNG